jgi:hypothetical protein
MAEVEGFTSTAETPFRHRWLLPDYHAPVFLTLMSQWTLMKFPKVDEGDSWRNGGNLIRMMRFPLDLMDRKNRAEL